MVKKSNIVYETKKNTSKVRQSNLYRTPKSLYLMVYWGTKKSYPSIEPLNSRWSITFILNFSNDQLEHSFGSKCSSIFFRQQFF